jgi:hypothetical protein
MAAAFTGSPKRVLAGAARSAEHGLGSARRIGGSVLDRAQQFLARLDRSLSGRPYEPYSMEAPTELPDHVLAQMDETAAGPSEWRNGV